MRERVPAAAMTRRRLLAALAAAAVLLAGGHFLLWRWAEIQLAQGFAQQTAVLAAEGWRIASAPPERGGWPLHARLIVPDVAVSGTLGPAGTLVWSAPRVVLDVALLAPRQLVVAVEGRQHLRLGDATPLPFDAEREQMVVPLTPRAPPDRATITLTGLRAGRDGAALRVAQASAVLTRPATQGATLPAFALEATGVRLPPAPGGRSWALGGTIARLAATGEATGSFDPSAAPLAWARGWRAAGGRLTLSRLSLHWGPLELDGEASVALDAGLQPEGSARLALTGQNPTLDALAAHRVLAPSAAQAAKAVLALIAGPPSGDAGSTVEVPLALHDRMLTMGRIPLLRLPRFDWSDLGWSATP